VLHQQCRESAFLKSTSMLQSGVPYKPNISCMPQHLQPGAMTRKSSVRGDRTNFGGHVDYEDDQDHDGSRHKYTRRGDFLCHIVSIAVCRL
jgi:hypothetical protein